MTDLPLGAGVYCSRHDHRFRNDLVVINGMIAVLVSISFLSSLINSDLDEMVCLAEYPVLDGS